jgi:hypothetical protein
LLSWGYWRFFEGLVGGDEEKGSKAGRSFGGRMPALRADEADPLGELAVGSGEEGALFAVDASMMAEWHEY